MRVAGISNINTLAASVPNLQMSQSYGAANVTLRGIGFLVNNIGSESPIATHFDGVYFQRTTGILGSFFDVQRLEVLRGAPGTLYRSEELRVGKECVSTCSSRGFPYT